MEGLRYTSSSGEIIFEQDNIYIIEQIKGLGGIKAKIQTEKSPFQDGASHVNTRLETRDIDIKCVTLGNSSSDLLTKIRELGKVFNPRLQGKLIYTNENRSYSINVRVEMGPSILTGRNNRGPQYQAHVISLVALDPFWTDVTVTSVSLSDVLPGFEFPLEIQTDISIQDLDYYGPDTILGVNLSAEVTVSGVIEVSGVETSFSVTGTRVIELPDVAGVGVVKITSVTSTVIDVPHRTTFSGRTRRVGAHDVITFRPTTLQLLNDVKPTLSGEYPNDQGNFTNITQETAIEHYSTAVEGVIKDMVLRGRTLRNLIDNGVNYGNWNVDSGSSRGANGIRLVASGVSEFARPNNFDARSLKTSTQYTVIYRVTSSNLTGNFVSFIDSSTILNKTVGVHKSIITTPSTIVSDNFDFRISDGVNGEAIDFEILAILEGDETSQDITESLTFGLNSVGTPATLPNGDSGYKMEILSVGKNLFDGEFKDEIINDTTGMFQPSNSAFRSGFIRVKPNTQYILSGASTSNNARIFSAFYITNNDNSYISRNGGTQKTQDIFTTPANCNFIAFNQYFIDSESNRDAIKNTVNIQLELGTTATTFEPYQSDKTEILSTQPWRSVGSVADEVSVVNGVGITTRNVGEVVLDGSVDESYNIRRTANGLTQFRLLDLRSIRKDDQSVPILSNDYNFIGIFENSPTTIGISIVVDGTAIPGLAYLTIESLVASTVSELRTYLASNNLIVDYQLATPTQEVHNPVQRVSITDLGPVIISTSEGGNVDESELSYPGNLEFGTLQQSEGSVTNESDVPVPIKISIPGPVINPRLTDVTTGDFIQVNSTIPAGSMLEINTAFGNKSVQLIDSAGTITNQFNLIELDSTFFELQVGGNLLRFTATQGQNTSTITIEYNNRYATI